MQSTRFLFPVYCNHPRLRNTTSAEARSHIPSNPVRGGSRGGDRRFGKQHSRYKAILSSIVLSQQCCELYFSLTVAKPLCDLTTKSYWNRPHLPNLTSWIRPWIQCRLLQHIQAPVYNKKPEATFRNIQALHRYHPVIVASIVETALVDGVLGQLFHHTQSIRRPSRFVKSWQRHSRLEQR